VRIVTGCLTAVPSSGYARTVIVVVGQPSYREPSSTESGRAVGAAVGVARAAAVAGAAVQLVARIGADAPGDAVLLDLARARIGHAAILRDPGHPTPNLPPQSDDDPSADAEVGAGLLSADPGPDAPARDQQPDPARGGVAIGLDPEDVELALRYLAGYGVIVVAEPLADATLAIVAEAAAFTGAQLIVVAAPGSARPALDPTIAVTILEAPQEDPDEQFAALVGRYAAALDAGVAADEAFRDALGAAGWESVPGST
jgi:hypothetical protein